MNKLIFACFLVFLSGSAAAANYGSAGCGLGSLAFGKKPGAYQVLAATLNGTSGNQTFGITSGTSNCGKGLFSASNKEFVENNIAQLKMDTARGQGEVLQAFSNIYGCQKKDVGTFGAAVQKKYEKIFSDDDATGVLERASTVITEGALCVS